LAFEWIRIPFRGWKPNTRYSECRYLQALKRTDFPLLTNLPAE
jgi:hypothetical protein